MNTNLPAKKENIKDLLNDYPAISLSETIRELGQVIDSINDQQYTTIPGPEFTSSIGAQTRHTLDHIKIFLDGLTAGNAPYDVRERGTEIETDRKSALKLISSICAKLDEIKYSDISSEINIQVQLHSHTPPVSLNSTVGREIGFLLNHSIHHNALVSIMLKKMGETVPPTFGYAPATIKYKNLE